MIKNTKILLLTILYIIKYSSSQSAQEIVNISEEALDKLVQRTKLIYISRCK